MPGRRERGFTLIEALMAATIMAGVIGLSATALISGQRAAGETVARQVTSNAVTTALAMMVPELRETGVTHVTISSAPQGSAGNTNQQIQFYKATGFDTTTNTTTFAATYVQYAYVAASKSITRFDQALNLTTTIASSIEPNFGFAFDVNSPTLLKVTIQAKMQVWDQSYVYFPDPAVRPAGGAAPPPAVQELMLFN